ncbi:MAG: ABC transporter substrate-binding protein [Methanocorpusculum sp.]|nr:ABC transporter substrate-binding protein [Methanocorpusculum sp.]
MSGHGHVERSKNYLRVTIVCAMITVVMLIIALHPYGVIPSGNETNTIDIAVLMPFTGEQSEFGIAYSRGVALAAQEINENGGINGERVDVEYYDYEGDLTKVKMKFFDIFDTKVNTIIGPLTSSETLEIAPYAEMFEVVLISPSATSEGLSEYSGYFYRTVPSDAYLGIGVAKILGNREDVSKIMVIYTSGSYGVGLKDGLKDEINASFPEKTVVSEFEIPEGDDADVEAIVSEMKSKDADGVFIVVSSPSQLVSILKGARDAGLSPLWIGTDNSVTTEINELGDYANGFMACLPSQISTDPMFESRFYEKFSTKDGLANAIYGYDTLKIVLQSIESRGKNSEDIKDGLDNIRYVGLTGAIKFDSMGDRYPSYDVMEYRDGEWTALKWSKMLDFSGTDTGHHE